MKLMRIEIEKSRLPIYRLVMLVLFLVTCFGIWRAFDLGYVRQTGSKHEIGSSIFYTKVICEGVFALVVAWAGTFGVKGKSNKDTQ